MMRPTLCFLVLSALVAFSLAAPALRHRGARQTEELNEARLMGLMRSGLKVLSDFSKHNLSLRTLKINTTISETLEIFDFNTSNSTYKELQEALNTTCKLHDANNTLARITLENDTTHDILALMSSRSVKDACEWTNDVLSVKFDSSYHLGCDNSSLTDLCDQWNDVVSLEKIQSKVTILKESVAEDSQRHINVTEWINRQNFATPISFLSETYECTDSGGVVRC